MPISAYSPLLAQPAFLGASKRSRKKNVAPPLEAGQPKLEPLPVLAPEPGLTNPKRWRWRVRFPGFGPEKHQAEKIKRHMLEALRKGKFKETRLYRISKKTVDHGGQALAWTGIAVTTGILLPGRPKDVIPVVVQVNAHLLALLFTPAKGLVSIYDLNDNAPAVGDQETRTRQALAESWMGQAVGWAVHRPLVENTLLPLGKKAVDNRAGRAIRGMGERFYNWLFYHKTANRISNALAKPLARGITAGERFKKTHGVPSSAAVEGTYGKVILSRRRASWLERMGDWARRLTGKNGQTYGGLREDVKFEVKLPTGTLKQRDLETAMANDLQQAFQQAIIQERQQERQYNRELKHAKQRSLASRLLAVPLLGALLNLTWYEGPKIAWTEMEGTYQPIGYVRDTYEFFGKPTGIPQLHPKAYIVPPVDNRCIVEIVDAWTKMRYWCVLRGTNMRELHRLPIVPFVDKAIDFLDQPIAGGLPSGRIMPSVHATEVMQIHPENEFWDWRKENHYTLWVERFHDTVVKQLPVSRITIESPEDISDPEARRLVMSLYTYQNGEARLTPEGMAVLAAVAGISLDDTYMTPDTNTDDKN